MSDTASPTFWGAHRTAQGLWQVALWAPSLADVSLRLEDGTLQPMVRGADGVHRLQVSAPEGTRYAYEAGGVTFADPAAVQQDSGVVSWSVLRDASRFRKAPSTWRGRTFDTAVFSELHVGTFTREGTFTAAARSPNLAALADLGVTAIELMPVGQFPGQRGWGYDGVLPWAPHVSYGTPDDLATLVDAAHDLGMMVFLDVVFNHFGPVGCSLTDICPEFFVDERNDWGQKFDYGRPAVRAYVIGCALHWLRAYDLDGLRIDAVHSMEDPSDPHIVVELARRVRDQVWPHPVHLVAEDSSNDVGWYEPQAGLLDATWNDDYHHALHALLTGETFGYYGAYSQDPQADLCRALRDGQALQGQARPAGQDRKGEPSAHLPPASFVNFNLNHDHAGNRPRGERTIGLVGTDRALVAHALLLAAPYTPLLFMGEEVGSRRPFPWFADYSGTVAQTMRDGRLRQFTDLPSRGEDMLDPYDPATAGLAWPYALPWPDDAGLWQDVTRAMLTLRREVLLPIFRSGRSRAPTIRALSHGRIVAEWAFHSGTLRADVSFTGGEGDDPPQADCRPLYALGRPEAPHFRLGLIAQAGTSPALAGSSGPNERSPR